MGKKVWVDLTHPFSAEIPRWPYFDKPVIDSKHSMAKGGVLTQYIGCTMHTGTHCDAPRHVMEREFDGRRARYTHEMAIDAYTGDAVCLDLHFMKRWERSQLSILIKPAATWVSILIPITYRVRFSAFAQVCI